MHHRILGKDIHPMFRNTGGMHQVWGKKLHGNAQLLGKRTVPYHLAGGSMAEAAKSYSSGMTSEREQAINRLQRAIR